MCEAYCGTRDSPCEAKPCASAMTRARAVLEAMDSDAPAAISAWRASSIRDSIEWTAIRYSFQTDNRKFATTWRRSALQRRLDTLGNHVADARIRFQCDAGNVRGEHHIWYAMERVLGRQGFLVEHIDGR